MCIGQLVHGNMGEKQPARQQTCCTTIRMDSKLPKDTKSHTCTGDKPLRRCINVVKIPVERMCRWQKPSQKRGNAQLTDARMPQQQHLLCVNIHKFLAHNTARVWSSSRLPQVCNLSTQNRSDACDTAAVCMQSCMQHVSASAGALLANSLQPGELKTVVYRLV
jgi:hypothetical protein